MPTASDELRARMERYFGNPISEIGPIAFLKSHGYSLRFDWQWEKPVPAHNISEDEYHCLRFLIEEWDFGGVYDATA